MNWFTFLLLIISIILFIFTLSFIIHLIVISKKEHIKLKKLIKPTTYKKPGKLKRLFKQFPEALARDILSRNPYELKEYGFHCFCGEQGSGKTISLVQRIVELKQKYPRIKVLTNFDCEYADGTVENWRDIVFTNNGVEGIVIALDEIQNWFSTSESKDFPPEMLQEITQQRKQRKMILATSQRFQRMAKPLREQINYLYEPFTVFGCLTVVRVIKPFVNDDGQLDRKRSRKVRRYFFVHGDSVRNSYDTYQKIERQANGGYIANRFSQEPTVQSINVAIDTRRRKL